MSKRFRVSMMKNRLNEIFNFQFSKHFSIRENCKGVAFDKINYSFFLLIVIYNNLGNNTNTISTHGGVCHVVPCCAITFVGNLWIQHSNVLARV